MQEQRLDNTNVTGVHYYCETSITVSCHDWYVGEKEYRTGFIESKHFIILQGGLVFSADIVYLKEIIRHLK